MCIDELKKNICAFFENRQMRITPSDLERMLCRKQQGLSSKVVRSAVKEMVTEGTLLYTNHFNTTHLELNFCRPVQVSSRIVLSPHGHTPGPDKDETRIIKMVQGGSFGIGDHPTTRLALRAMDNLMAGTMAEALKRGVTALDIGTGSGVLAIAAVRLGAERAVAVDIDPVALHEARQNIRLNDLGGQILVTGDSLESLIGREFDLVMANLRPPTIRQIMPMLEALSSKGAYWVLSGFRNEAVEDVARMLVRNNAEILDRQKACDWAALTVKGTRKNNFTF